MKNIYKIFLLLILIVCKSTLYGQSDFDSLYNDALIYVYDDPDKALEIGKDLYEKNLDEPERLINILMLTSNAHFSKRDYEKSLEDALKANELASKINDPAMHLMVLIKTADRYHQLGVNDKSLEILDESDLLYETIKDKESVKFIMGGNYAIRGFIYRDQLSCDIAIDYLNKAYNAFLSTDSKKRMELNNSIIAYNKGNCFITLNQLDSAKINFENSKRLAISQKANSLQAFSMKGLAEVYMLQMRYEDAISELNRADSISASVGDLELNSGIYRGLSDNYLALKDWDNFRKYENKNRQTIQQIKESERKTINNILKDYKTEIESNEKSSGNKFILLIFILSIVLFGFVFSIVRSEISFKKDFDKIISQIKS